MSGDPSRIGLISDPLPGSAGASIPLDVLGQVSGVRFSTQYPGGDTELTCSLTLDPLAIPDALRIGRGLRASLAGAVIWSGRYDTPTAGQPWTITATGLGGLAGSVLVLTGNTTNTNIDAKIGSGEAPWTRGGSFPDGPQPTTVALWTLTDFLNNMSSLTGTRWVVGPDGVVVPKTDPTSPDYLLVATTVPGRTAVDYWNGLFGMYIDSTTLVRTLAIVSNTDSISAHGNRETPVDLTSFGAMTLAQAQSYLGALLTRSGYRASFTSPLIATTGQLLTYPGGAPVDLATVRAGCMVRVLNLDPDQGGEVGVGSRDVIIGETVYDVDADNLEIHPVELARVDLQQSLLALVQATQQTT